MYRVPNSNNCWAKSKQDDMIYLDFFSGSHGHFLEYVINTWLFKGPRVSHIFTSGGTSHGIRSDQMYMQHRMIQAAHYSEFDIALSNPSKLVRISIDQPWSNWIYQINVMTRAGDIPLEKKIMHVPESVRNESNKLRNNWYAKFNFSENGYQLPGNWTRPDLPSFDFPMESLFDTMKFYTELYKLAGFLETTFVPDQELSALLDDFLNKNQGWQYYTKSKQLVAYAFAGKKVDFTSDEILQALINSMLSASVGVFDGKLFDQDTYPSDTLGLSASISEHLQTFDQRF
jgi:hypothetical protein